MQIFRIIKEGFSNFVRNGWLSVASITIMVLTLLTMSIFIIINIVLNSGIKTIQDKIDISVYLKDSAKQTQVIDLQNSSSNMTNVKAIKYTSKDDALAKYKEQNANNPVLLESIKNQDSNPLPASLEIKVYDPNKLDDLTGYFDSASAQPLVEKVSYKENKAVIDKLFKATQFTKQVGLIATIAFTITSLVIIFNTVRMAIFTRREEIEIMKLVGATPNYIKAPFLIEGALYGIISTIIAMLVLSSILYFSAPAMVRYFGESGNNVSGFLRDNFLLIFFAQALVGVAIGVISSFLAIRKHLQKLTTA
jgi:cell division transport system permease protein